MAQSNASEREKRDRPAINPGGMECEQCGLIFIGEEWHALCAICLAKSWNRRAHLNTKKGLRE